jgi:hypothetical protein
MPTYTPSSLSGVIGGDPTIYHITSDTSAPWFLQYNNPDDNVVYTTSNVFTDAAGTVLYDGAGSLAQVYIKIPPVPTPNANWWLRCGQAGGFVNITTSIARFIWPPSFSYDFSPTLAGVIVNNKKSGAISGRIMGDGVLRRNFNLRFDNLTVADYTEIERFYKQHAPGRGIKFLYTDAVLGVSGNFLFNSPPQVSIADRSRLSVTLSILGVP